MSLCKIETIALNEDADHFAIIYKETDCKEYCVKFYQCGIYAEEADYFTDNLLDAQRTAQYQVWTYTV